MGIVKKKDILRSITKDTSYTVLLYSIIHFGNRSKAFYEYLRLNIIL